MLDTAVHALRQFNRSFTPRVGVLDESFLGTGRPLAAARLLFEIGQGAVPVHELRRRLGVDAGYLSRLVRRLVDDGLIDVVDDAVDGRRRSVRLTEAGRLEWGELDDRSDANARRVLAPLTTAQQAELVAALAKADRLLRLTTVSLEAVEPDSAGALSAMESYFAELDRRFAEGFDVGADFDAELDSMREPTGGFVVVDDDGTVVGCGGLHRIDDQTAEIKRMWLDSSLRGLGVGARLLARLEELALALGYSVVVLDTNAVLTQAISMYERAGYEPIERYNDNPYAHHWFRKTLR